MHPCGSTMDQRAKRGCLRTRALDQPFDSGLGGEVRAATFDPQALLSGGRQKFIRRLLIANIIRYDQGTGARETVGDGPAHAPGAARHQYGFSLKGKWVGHGAVLWTVSDDADGHGCGTAAGCRAR